MVTYLAFPVQVLFSLLHHLRAVERLPAVVPYAVSVPGSAFSTLAPHATPNSRGCAGPR